MYYPLLQEVQQNLADYMRLKKAIQKAQKDLPTWAGKPKAEVIQQAIGIWEKDLKELEPIIYKNLKDLSLDFKTKTNQQ